jgi:IS30 family transposase
MVTLLERHSRFTTLIKVPSKHTTVVVAALSRQVRELPATLRRSHAWDRGLEMAKHKTFTAATGVKLYFCDSQSPWQRGAKRKTGMGHHDNTSLGALTCPAIRKRMWTKWRCG